MRNSYEEVYNGNFNMDYDYTHSNTKWWIPGIYSC